MDKSNEIELLQAQLIQERALVQDLEAGKSKMILDAIEVGGQFLDLCEAVRVLKEVLQFVMLKAPGYDWNTDPLSITLMVGNALTKSNHVLAGEPDEENDSLQAQLTQRTAELEAAKQHHEQSENAAQLYYRELTRAKNRICEAAGLPPDSGYEPAIKHLQAELERVRGLVKALPKVEGEIAVKHTEVDLSYVWGITLNGYFTFQSALFDGKEEAEAYATILKHRQGMEG